MNRVVATILAALVGGGLILWSLFVVPPEEPEVEVEPSLTQLQAYTLACNAEVGEIPAFSCADGVSVPVTVNGLTPATYTPFMTCDHPALLNNGPDSDGQCVPHSRILNLSTDTHQIAVMCRQKKIRDASSMLFDEIDIITHNPQSGATCWFQAGDKGVAVDGTAPPDPGSNAGMTYWNSPADVVAADCGGCHDNDPYMYSPFVGQIWGEHIPTDPFGPYYHVAPGFGFDAWPTTSITPRDNTCVGCHRIGIDQTCGELTQWMTGELIPPGADELAQSFPLSHAMPIGQTSTLRSWEVLHLESVANLHSCCDDPTREFCKAERIPRFP